jgi:uncharacterized protein (UPF0332 family)
MTQDQRDLLLKAQDSLAAAKVLLENGYPGFAAARAYYVRFYVAEAFLEGEGMAFSKHSAVIAAFGQHFAHTSRVPIEFHRFLLEAQELREDGDYGPPKAVTDDQASEQIARAEQFLQLASRLISPNPSGGQNQT